MDSPSTTAVLSVAAVASLALYAVTQRSAAAVPAPAADKPKDKDNRWIAEELISRRRSIFPQDYDQKRHVPKEILEKMLEAANWAPTHARTEPWRFVVFASPESRQALGELEAGLYKKMCPEDRFIQKKYNKKIESKTASSYVIAICMKRQESEKLPEIEEVCAVACAVQNMHLVATAHGVGAYWSSGPPIFSDDMKQFLGLSAKDKCLGLFYVGYPKGGLVLKGARKSIKDKVQWK